MYVKIEFVLHHHIKMNKKYLRHIVNNSGRTPSKDATAFG